tara:strand:- start:373 stop:564 length:192 start_codon:yes stop_codon:yes gene_type:complete
VGQQVLHHLELHQQDLVVGEVVVEGNLNLNQDLNRRKESNQGLTRGQNQGRRKENNLREERNK